MVCTLRCGVVVRQRGKNSSPKGYFPEQKYILLQKDIQHCIPTPYYIIICINILHGEEMYMYSSVLARARVCMKTIKLRWITRLTSACYRSIKQNAGQI